jgi:hypothetical protein
LFAGTALARSETQRAIDAELLRRDRLASSAQINPELLPLFNEEYQRTYQPSIFSQKE